MAESLDEKLSYLYKCVECGREELFYEQQMYLCEECQHPMDYLRTVDRVEYINTNDRERGRR